VHILYSIKKARLVEHAMIDCYIKAIS